MVNKDFDTGEYVWAKMKGFPMWPAKIAEPKGKPKKGHHYVFFLASNNYAWISDENIAYHSQEMVDAGRKRKLGQLQEAIDMIEKEATFSSPKKKQKVEESPVKESSKPDKFDKLLTSKYVKVKYPKKKKVLAAGQVRLSEFNGLSSPRRDEIEEEWQMQPKTFSLTDKTIATNVPPVRDNAHLPSAIFKRRDYIERPSTPPLVMEEGPTGLAADFKPTSKKIGFIGLGDLARGIVKNLLNSKHDVTIWHVNPSVCDPYVKAGAKTATTVGDVVESCDIIFSYVADSEEVKKNIFGNYGVLKSLDNTTARSKGYVELTTMDAGSVKEIAKEICVKGTKYLEAPVGGSRTQALNGDLMVIAGGDQELFNACESCFMAFAKTAYFVSLTVGQASKMNIIVSNFEATVIAALAEALSMAKCCQLSIGDVAEVLKMRPVNSQLIQEKALAMSTENYTWETPLQNQKRDLSLAFALANECNQPVPITGIVNEVYKRAKQKCYGEHDVSAVIEAIRLDNDKS